MKQTCRCANGKLQPLQCNGIENCQVCCEGKPGGVMPSEGRTQLRPSQPYITGVPSSGVIGPASGIGFSGGYRNASGKMGFASSLGLVGIIGIFGALYLLNRYLEAQPKR